MSDWTIHKTNTRHGIIPRIDRMGSVVAFTFSADLVRDAQGKHRARRAAVSWIAANPRKQATVTSFRFDILQEDGEILRDAF